MEREHRECRPIPEEISPSGRVRNRPERQGAGANYDQLPDRSQQTRKGAGSAAAQLPVCVLPSRPADLAGNRRVAGVRDRLER